MELEEAIKVLQAQLDTKTEKGYYKPMAEEETRVVLNHLTKQDKMIELLKTRIFVSSEEHEQILKIQEKHRNKSYEDCTIEYFEKKTEEAE